MKKLSVVWICHFSNQKIREKLPLTKKRLYYDFAPWITNLINEFEKRNDIELHIIAPHNGLLKQIFSFEKNNINYHFFKPDIPILHRNWPWFIPVNKLLKHAINRYLVHRYVRKINPDIINLHGAENDYYSITALDIKNIPVYVCIQGIYSNPERFNSQNKPNHFKIKVERMIHKKCKYFGIFPPFFADLIKRDNNDPILLNQAYIPKTNFEVQANVIKKFDFVFWGRVADVKGIDKILEAIAFLKRNGRNTTLNIIGYCSKDYMLFLEKKINFLNISDNVTFSGHLQTLKDVHSMALEARVAVISSKFENLPGTILESVFLGIPVTATNVGGIPYLNKNGETILLADYGDINKLADNMIKLLDNPKFASEITQKCKEFIIKEFDSGIIVDRYIQQYHAIIANYKYKTAIPDYLLFDKKYFENKGVC